jgi:DNA (cytosine-5)-methyltransferase 1
MLKIGSLCTGYGGLDMAAEQYFNAETVWVSEIDKHANQVIQLRLNKPNLGDLKKIDWENVEPIDILTAGYPCQPFSEAGNRKGENDKRHIWPSIKKGISILRPSYIILENVRGHLSLGFKEVLKDLAELRYDAKWQVIRASDIGAPHQRARLFVVAYPNGDACQESRRSNRTLQPKGVGLRNGQDQGQTGQKHGVSCETASHSNNSRGVRDLQGLPERFNSSIQMHLQDIPNTLDQDGKLNPKFVEYMMGLPEGWVTDAGLSRTQQLKMLGNGVVPQQALFALSQIMR